MTRSNGYRFSFELVRRYSAAATSLVFVVRLAGFLRRIRAGFVLSCHADQETDKIIQLARTEPRSMVSRHQRLRSLVSFTMSASKGPHSPLDNPN